MQTDFTAIFRKPSGELVFDTSTYYSPASEALEAAEEDAHRYGWELVACKPSIPLTVAE